MLTEGFSRHIKAHLNVYMATPKMRETRSPESSHSAQTIPAGQPPNYTVSRVVLGANAQERQASFERGDPKRAEI